jgi:hypothetical protein
VVSVIRRLARRLRADGGFTVVELSVAMILSSLVFAAFTAVIYSFSQQAGDQGRTATLQGTSREFVADMVVELRQAVKVSPNGYPIEELDPGRIVFYSDRLEPEGPERIVYERRDCGAETCELWVIRYPAVAGTGPWWEYSETPLEESRVLTRVSADQPLFAGIEWSGDPPAKVYIEACGSVQACDFPLVAVTFRANPVNTSAGEDDTFEVDEEVRLRNA